MFQLSRYTVASYLPAAAEEAKSEEPAGEAKSEEPADEPKAETPTPCEEYKVRDSVLRHRGARLLIAGSIDRLCDAFVARARAQELRRGGGVAR